MKENKNYEQEQEALEKKLKIIEMENRSKADRFGIESDMEMTLKRIEEIFLKKGIYIKYNARN